jgi:type IV secretion system protein VirB10
VKWWHWRRPAEQKSSELDDIDGKDSDSSGFDQDDSHALNATGVAGERRIPSVNRVRSLQSRISSALAIALVSLLGLGLLVWYYGQALTRGERAQRAAEREVQQRAQGEMALPPLGPIERPRVVAADEPRDESKEAHRVLGPPPPAPPYDSRPTPASRISSASASTESTQSQALERRLAGAVLITTAGRAATGRTEASYPNRASLGSMPSSSIPGQSAAAFDSVVSPNTGELEALLTPSVMPASQARVLPSRRLMLPKGTFIDCTLETAIVTSLTGLVTCITATDTFSADGSVVLLERATKLFGETRGQVQAGSARVFVLWNEARTPSGVVAPLESPGTDELGRSGLPGRVNRHFFERFGAALLISIVDGAVQAGAQSQSEGTVVVNPSTSSQVMTEVLRNTINVRPTVLKHQGDRIQILAARDVDFRSVYALRTRQ